MHKRCPVQYRRCARSAPVGRYPLIAAYRSTRRLYYAPQPRHLLPLTGDHRERLQLPGSHLKTCQQAEFQAVDFETRALPGHRHFVFAERQWASRRSSTQQYTGQNRSPVPLRNRSTHWVRLIQVYDYTPGVFRTAKTLWLSCHKTHQPAAWRQSLPLNHGL